MKVGATTSLTQGARLDELKAGLDAYIRYYNVDRIKLKLGSLSPVDYRTQFMSK